jgi:hypothetical protein
VLFFGYHSNSPYCYGPGTNDPDLHGKPAPGGVWCYDPCNSAKGGHGYPYVHYVWAYDANDLLKVKNGEKEPWEILPYAGWEFDDLTTSGCASISSAGYDPATRRLYFAQSVGERPRIDVFEINVSISDGTAPAAPGNLRLRQ